MATIYDIARLANVSAMTVSRVINNTGRVSEKTRVKVKQVMEEMHYIPNSVARCLVTQESKVLSLLITDITNPFFTTIARGAEDAALKHGYRLMFGNSDENLLKERQYVEMILSMRVDGVLFAPSNDMSFDHLQWLERQNVPFVLLDREVPGIVCDTVLGDSRAGAKQLVREMIRQGHTRIGLVNGLEHVSTARERRAGYEDALREAGLPIDEKHIVTASYIKDKQDLILNDWFERTPEERPTAIFAANNMLALTVFREARERGLRVPEDMSIACFDDLGTVENMNSFYSVASQPAYDFGQIGIQLLLDRIRNRNQAPKLVKLPCEIKHGGSVIPYEPTPVAASSM
ncbi:LacI family transcriptional regulator [Paenibacillus sp. ACRRX]|uniref:LacI family DNA-binding transcriptional regulator n=1 Tax=unclassified Paenibacillus TaxID=185978 RepID=UPI001EF56895|nr:MULTISPECIES: LacI family DNA-binding transcriptional regulator [unclassified Paenibacillus]MCG7406242.1 LacI family transcriptional regulator [Paenibacillus sp. ACRRX]MDK8179275.1 LacI family DNA-binding transcriptional regulator [Paenibacillus sp. UMB4589-SE434]